MPDDAASEVRDNPSRHRFELTVDGATAFVLYKRLADRVILIHTEVPDALAGKGVGGRLARGTLDAIRAEGIGLVPQCPFIAAYIGKHPEYRDLVVS